MKTYCGKCKKECDLRISIGPEEFEHHEFWGTCMVSNMGREIAALSECCMYSVYEDKDCRILLDERKLDL